MIALDNKIVLTQEKVIEIVKQYNSLYDYFKKMKEENNGYKLEELSKVALFQLFYKEHVSNNSMVESVLVDSSKYKLQKFRKENRMTGLFGDSTFFERFSLEDENLDFKLKNETSKDYEKLDVEIMNLELYEDQAKEEVKISIKELEEFFVEFQKKSIVKLENENSSSFLKMQETMNLGSAKIIFNELIKDLEIQKRLIEREEQIEETDQSILSFEIKLDPSLDEFLNYQAIDEIIEELLEQIQEIFNALGLNGMAYYYVLEEAVKEYILNREFTDENEQAVSILLSFPANSICIDNHVHGEIALHVKGLYEYTYDEEDEVEEMFHIDTFIDVKNSKKLVRRYNEDDLQEIAECFGEDLEKLKEDFGFYYVDRKEGE